VCTTSTSSETRTQSKNCKCNTPREIEIQGQLLCGRENSNA
jgi:hypothetical protein